MADVFDDENETEEQTVSLNEYLEEVEHQELEADLVLGGDEGKECTYAKGYMKRQAIFSCLTCVPDGNAGVCTACSLSCHDGHEIIELWTKRKFKCDCGNSKFGEGYCKLLPSKDIENEENAYDHTFKGKYCTCDRPYPDPDAEEQVEMIQCCICEDWFHEAHLGHESTNEVKIPVDEEGEPLYEDLICHKCSSICSFLHLYPPTIWASDKEHAATPSKGKDVVSSPSASGSSIKLEDGTSEICDAEPAAVPSGSSIKLEDGTSEIRDADPAAVPSVSSIKLEDGTSEIRDVDPAAVPDGNLKSPHDDKDVVLGEKYVTCVLGVDLLATELASEKSQPMFLAKNWREALCGCVKCSDFYAQKGISYLLDKEDSIAEYEKMAKQKRDEKMQQQEGAELNFLGNLGHVQKIEILSGINDMKDEIRSFLQSYDPSKPITSNDIHQVFDNLKKRRRMD